jgi:hypothetical protein
MSLVGSLRGVQAIPEPCNSNSNSNSIYNFLKHILCSVLTGILCPALILQDVPGPLHPGRHFCHFDPLPQASFWGHTGKFYKLCESAQLQLVVVQARMTSQPRAKWWRNDVLPVVSAASVARQRFVLYWLSARVCCNIFVVCYCRF